MFNEDANERLHETARRTSREIVLAHLGWPAERLERDPVGAIRAALAALPESGPISEQTEQLLVRAIAWLVNDVPLGTPGKGEAERALAEAMHRVLGSDGHSW